MRPPRPFVKAVRDLRAGALRRTEEPAADCCLGIMRDHWGTANYRVRFPLEDLLQSAEFGESRFHVVKDDGFEPGPALQGSAARHVVIQPFLSDEGLRMMEFH